MIRSPPGIRESFWPIPSVPFSSRQTSFKRCPCGGGGSFCLILPNPLSKTHACGDGNRQFSPSGFIKRKLERGGEG
jgi:hypothetical protein